MRGRVVIVSNRLPVNVYEQDGTLRVAHSNGGLATALASVFTRHNPVWVGWTGHRAKLAAAQLEALQLPPGLVPVNLSADVIERYYDTFANRVLWPTAHGLAPCAQTGQEDWQAFCAASEAFADAVTAVARPEDRLWIHDYHLLLLPAMLRKRGLKNRLGFFLHTPFPTIASLRKLPRAEELLASLGDVNVLGLQTERDVRRFKRLTQHFPHVRPPQRLAAFPIGIDPGTYKTAHLSPEAREYRSEVKRRARGRRVILSISRLDYTKGIPEQIRAIEQLFSALPNRERHVYHLVVAPSRESTPEYRELRETIETLVAEANSKLSTASWKPIEYTYENLPLHKVAAWYREADVLLNTPIIDGMNLVAKEYVAVRHDKPGALVLSKTMGAARQLKDAFLTPPRQVEAIRGALHSALHLSHSERDLRWQKMKHNVETEDVHKWAAQFLACLDGDEKAMLTV